ncbi:hypothetical protein AAVH_32693 [Aphelenchoides avenae]|nr:hypothetical protein AAVH_32693 [Aphelenchus avenae]
MPDDHEAAIREKFHDHVEPLVLAGAAFVVDVCNEVILVWFWCVVAKAYRFALMSYGKL